MSDVKNIKLLAFDVDGTLTPGDLIFGKEGEVYKSFCVKDGMAMGLAHYAGFITGFITGRSSDIVKKRGEELHIDFLLMGIENKEKALENILKKYRISWEEVAYMGDDLNDLPLFSKVGLSGCPADSCKEIIMTAGFVSQYNGGKGAAREFIEKIMKAQNRWNRAVEHFISLRK